jgi:predicted transcriptional regulator
MPQANSGGVKAEAQRLIESLPDNATWDDVMYRIYVRQCVDAGIKDADAGRVVDADEVRQRFGLVP